MLLCRARLVRQQPQVEPVRCALTAIHFPEHRTLTGDDSTAEPLPAALQQLAATAEALIHCSGHRPTAGSGAHRPAAATAAGPLHDDIPQHGSKPEEDCQADSTPGKAAAVGKGAAAVEVRDAAVEVGGAAVEVAAAASEPVRHHAAGHDPVWLLLYAVKVKLAQCQPCFGHDLAKEIIVAWLAN